MIRKAEQHEKAQYAATNPIHPLYGFIKVAGSLGGVKGSWQCAIEYLGEGPGEPNYEIMAPAGMHFYDGNTLHTLLATTLADARERAKYSTLEVCGGC